MEIEIMQRLVELGPWGAAVAIVFMVKREFVSAYAAPHADKAIDQLLGVSVEQRDHFARNIRLMEDLGHKVESIENAINSGVEVQRQILLAMVRGK